MVGKPMTYNLLSRDFMLFIGMLLLLALGVVVLFWSSLPLLTKYISENPAAAEISTYNTFAFPFAILIALFLTEQTVLSATTATTLATLALWNWRINDLQIL